MRFIARFTYNTNTLKHVIGIALTLIAIATAMVLLLSAYGGHVDPRSFALPSLATLALPVVAFVALLVLVLCIALRSKWPALIVFAAILLSRPALITVCPLSHSSEPQNPDSTFTVMTWNVIGFEPMTDNTPCSTIKAILDADADVVLLQEASLDGYDEFLKHYMVAPVADEVIKRYPYRSTGPRDVMILSKQPYTVMPDTTLVNNQSHDSINEHFHYFGKVFDLNVKGHELRIINLHMQSIGLTSDDKQLYNDIATLNRKVNTKDELRDVKHSLYDKLSAASSRRAGEADAVRSIVSASGRNVIVCGDFNDTPSSFSYLTIKGDDLRDSFVDCATWPVNTFNDSRLYFKIDHMLYRGDMRAIKATSPRVGASDHYPLVTTFEWCEE